MPKSYTAYSRNIGPDLQKALPDKVKIGVVTLRVELTLEDAGYKKVTESPVWLQKSADIAKKFVPGAVDSIVDDIKKAKDLNDRGLNSILVKTGDEMADKLADAIEKALAAWVKDKKEYTSYKVKSAGKIVVGTAGVVASAVTIGLTAGAASPVAIISMARSSIGLAQNIAKLAMEAETVERLIRKDMGVLSKAFAKNKDNKAAQNMKELGLAGIAAVLGVDTPSINNCNSRIQLYGNKLTGLKKDHAKFAGTIYKLMDVQESLKHKIDKTAKSAKNYGKLTKTLGSAEKSLDEILKRVVAIGERIDTGEKNNEVYSKFVEALQSGVSNWTKYAQTAMTLAITFGTAIANNADAIEKGLSALQDHLTTVKDDLLESA